MKGHVYLQLAPTERQVYHASGECPGKPNGHYGPGIRVVGATTGRPRVARGNLLVKVSLVLPDDAFTTFVPEATITLAPSQVAAIAVAAEDMADEP